MAASTTDLFINLIQNSSIIYDKTLKDFKNVRKKEERWAYIAQQSRMTVEDAKKRYFSLRQKYSREKKNCEVKRRNKIIHRSGWVFYDRLQFLDAFILPRATFTNDTEFMEEETLDDGEIGNIGQNNAQQSIDIEVDDSINVNELDVFLGDNNINTLPTANEQVENPVVHVDDIIIHKQVECPNVFIERVVSQYSGEMSEAHFSQYEENDTNMDGGELGTNKSATTETEEGHCLMAPPSDEENYISLLPSTSSSEVNFSSKRTAAPSSVSTASESLPPGITAGKVRWPLTRIQPLLSNDGQNRSRCTSQLQTDQQLSSRHNVSAPKGRTSSQTVNKPSSSKRSVAPKPGTTSKEISMDAIRNKMDSCLNAMTNKITDNAHRSPHAPFLAYLGTKLPNVPQEIIPKVEEELLEIVKFYSVRQGRHNDQNSQNE